MTIIDATPSEVVIKLDLKHITPDPANPRGKLRDIDQMAASIRQVGVLDPVIVRPWGSTTEGGVKVERFIVTHGHRRTAGAREAGLDQIPCIIRDETDDAGRAVGRLVENLQRDNLNPAEEARGVQQLLDLGVDVDTVATKLAVPLERVTGAAAIAKSKPTTAIVERHAAISFDQALVLVEFDGDKEAMKAITAAAVGSPEEYPHLVSQLRQERDRAAIAAVEAKVWKDKGYAILDETPRWGDKDTEEIGYLALNEQKKSARLTVDNHAECDGRAVYIDIRYNGTFSVRHYCVKWKKHNHVKFTGRGPSSSSGSKKPAGAVLTPAEQKAKEAETLKRRIHLAALNAGRAAEVVRREFVRELLNRKAPPVGTLRFVSNILLTYDIRDENKMFRELTGIDPPSPKSSSWWESEAKRAHMTFVKARTDAQLPLALLAIVAAHIETGWEPNTWDVGERRSESARADLRKDYLTFLVNAGYAPALIERVLLGTAKGKEVLAESDRIKAMGKAGKTAVKTAVPQNGKPQAAAPKPAKAAKKTAKPAVKTAVKRAVRRAPARPKPALN